MATTTDSEAESAAIARRLVEALAVRDFGRLAATVEPHGIMEALLPRGLRTCRGTAEIQTAFEEWFGDTDDFQVADASIDHVGPVVQLRWRLLIHKPSRASGSLVVVQQAFAQMGASGLVSRLALVCSGFQEHDRA